MEVTSGLIGSLAPLVGSHILTSAGSLHSPPSARRDGGGEEVERVPTTDDHREEAKTEGTRRA